MPDGCQLLSWKIRDTTFKRYVKL